MSEKLEQFKNKQLEKVEEVIDELAELCPFEPVDDRMAVVPCDMPDQKSQGGLVLPPKAQDKKTFCLVVLVGEGFRDNAGNRRPMAFKPGDKVLMNNVMAECSWRADGIDFSIVKEGNVIGKLA